MRSRFKPIFDWRLNGGLFFSPSTHYVEGMSDENRDETSDEDRADLRGQDELPNKPEKPKIASVTVPEKKEGTLVKTFFKSPTLWGWIGIVVVIIFIIFSVQGFSSWRANGHKDKACNAIYLIGNTLPENLSWGQGINSTTPASKAKLDYAVSQAEAAASADSSHFAYFQNAMITFAYSLEGDDLGGQLTLYSPYLVYTYALDPICINFGYLDNQ